MDRCKVTGSRLGPGPRLGGSQRDPHMQDTMGDSKMCEVDVFATEEFTASGELRFAQVKS